MNQQNMADKKRSIGIFKTIHSITGVRVAALAVLMVALSATAKAQCGDSLSAMAASAASVRSQSQVRPSSKRNKSVAAESATTSDNAVNTSIVGLWHIRFLVGDQQIQEAFQIWNAGGTEVHNPNVNPSQGNVCLGTWKEAAPQIFKLTHRVWNYEGGVFQGTIHLDESLVLGDKGNTHNGSFTLDFYDPFGNFLFEVPGTVVGERISVN